VTLAALQAGVVPHDLRRWGGVFQQAARDRVICRSPRVLSRAMGHGALTLGWVAL